MKSAISVGLAVISGFLLICHFCTFVSCEEPCGEGCDLDDKGECICGPAEVQRKNLFPFSNQRDKRSGSCAHHGTVCESSGDPHITTFRGHYYHIYKDGVFTLVKHDTRSLWIQVRQAKCGIVSCNCGVLAREGNSIIGITRCYRDSTRLVRYQLSKGAPSGYIRTIQGRGWKITLVSGIEIEVIMWGDKGQYMHLYVKGLNSEIDKYQGLCSATSDNVLRDFQCIHRRCNYKVENGESFFHIDQQNLLKCESDTIYPQCGCLRGYPKCPESDNIGIETIDKYKCKQPQIQRQNNEENDVFEGKNHIPSDSLNGPIESEVVDRGLNMGYRFLGRVRDLNPNPPVKTVEDGGIRCNDALKLSPTYELCSSKVDTSTMVESCALDENLMKEDGPAKSVATEFETVCLDNIRLSIEADASSQELKDLLAKVEKLVCPSQCSQNGKCVDSKCQCNKGFSGTDCSQRIAQAPVVKERGESSTNCDDGFEDCT